MIIDAFLTVSTVLMETVIGAIPALPSFPTEITGALSYIQQLAYDGIGLVKYVYGPPFFTAILVCVMALLFFENIYHFIMYVLRKIPILNIK